QWSVKAELAFVLLGHLFHPLLNVSTNHGLLEQTSPDRIFAGQARSDEVEGGGHPNKDKQHEDAFEYKVNAHLAVRSPGGHDTESRGARVKRACQPRAAAWPRRQFVNLGYCAGVSMGALGSSNAAIRPTTANTNSTVTARAYPSFGWDTRLETMTVPAIATPSDEPRFETLRDRPEISPWSASEKLDCTTLTDAVSIIPTPKPTSRRLGTKGNTPDVPGASSNSRAMPAIVNTKPARISVAW